MQMQFSRSGEGATGGTPRVVSQNSAVRAALRQAAGAARGAARLSRDELEPAPGLVDVLDAPAGHEAHEPALV
jgi:hypothetical protein